MGDRMCGSQGNEGLGLGRLDEEGDQFGLFATDTMGKPRGNLGLSMGLLGMVSLEPPPSTAAAAASEESSASESASTLTSSSPSTTSSSSFTAGLLVDLWLLCSSVLMAPSTSWGLKKFKTLILNYDDG